jgi:hypothetical protein
MTAGMLDEDLCKVRTPLFPVKKHVIPHSGCKLSLGLSIGFSRQDEDREKIIRTVRSARET